MFEGLDFSKMGEMLEEVQKRAKELEDESMSREFSVKSGGGLISVKANGKGEILDITIDDSLLEDKESLQILLISAVNDLLKMVEDDKKHLASKMLGGFTGMRNQ
ncbi:YbaB/EbfC family nucleoid-associated protein [Campylobacter sp.]|uniref:YbaB/EbfC family nucleoid-associated protein n=1 Tax=Campylobacter sp. TaxID=205 RepID=UPI0026FE6697|nr:YbaB/EbfC family nucleoid-associated protein [Campylobacter sp.]